MTDTHCHLYDAAFADEGAEAVERAIQSGVDRMVFPSIDLANLAPMLGLASRFPGRIFLAKGLHPTELKENWEEELAAIMERMKEVPVVAVGEIGLDLHWEPETFQRQSEALSLQFEIALKEGLPVIFHSRDAHRETIHFLEEFKKGHEGRLPEIVFHSFTGTPQEVRELREHCDPMFGINGVVTFKNAKELPEAVKEIGPERLLLETDSPYLAPVPKRGRRNESSFLPFIRDKVADILGLTPEEVSAATDSNARRFFKALS